MVACRPGGQVARQLAGLPLVFDHPRLLVVDKPAGLLCQPGLGAHQRDSLISRLQQWHVIGGIPQTQNQSIALVLMPFELL